MKFISPKISLLFFAVLNNDNVTNINSQQASNNNF